MGGGETRGGGTGESLSLTLSGSCRSGGGRGLFGAAPAMGADGVGVAEAGTRGVGVGVGEAGTRGVGVGEAGTTGAGGDDEGRGESPKEPMIIVRPSRWGGGVEAGGVEAGGGGLMATAAMSWVRCCAVGEAG
jgi:hypothetical protein